MSKSELSVYSKYNLNSMFSAATHASCINLSAPQLIAEKKRKSETKHFILTQFYHLAIKHTFSHMRMLQVIIQLSTVEL